MTVVKSILSSLLALIGVVSVFMTLSIIFDLFGIRKMEGNYVLLIVYTNFLCGLIYIYAALTLWKHLVNSTISLALATALLIAAYIWFTYYIQAGGVYEEKTLKAMTFRTIFTAVMFALCFILFKIEQRKMKH
jgi:hypothetical protein